MVKAWHVIVGIAILAFIATVIIIENASRQGQEVTIEMFLPVIVIVAISGVVFAIWKIWKSPKGPGQNGNQEGIIRGGLSMAEAKFIAAMHLFTNQGIDIFAAGKTPETARYITNLIANRCYPAAGEEAWYVRLKIRDKKYFQGMPTRVIIYMDGVGNVTDDPIMNEMTFIDSELWRNPETHFLKGTSKTSRPRSLRDIVARHVQETGEFPAQFQPSQLEGYKEEGK